jgi:hypothetical protein
MKSYRRLRLFAVAALLAELCVGLGGVLTPRAEIFPFASWFLFSLVPGKTSDYDLVLRAQGGRQFDPAPRFSQAGWMVATPHSIVAYQLIQQLGHAVEHHDARVAALRQQIEAQFTLPGVRYDVVKASYLPVERWKNDQTLSLVPLGSFVSGQP